MAKKLSIELAQYSDKGKKDQNEDFYGAVLAEATDLENKGIAIAIADGMSASEGGKEASQIAVTMFLQDYYATSDSWTVKTSVHKVMTSVNRWLYSNGQRDYDSPTGMVTTFSALVLKSQTLHLFHVGDSRVYRFRAGKLSQLTRDHRVYIRKDRDYLSRALGIDINVDIDYMQKPLEIGDIYFSSTDGIHDFINDKQLTQIITNHQDDLEQCAKILVETALKQNSQDNLTCQLLRIETLPSAEQAEFIEKLTQLPFPPDLAAGNILDHFKIIRELNASARSQVYLAEEISSKEQVVIKTPSVNFEDDPSYIDLFLHEEWVGKRLKSDHLIKVCDYQKKRTFLYTVVQYIQGQNLQQWMNDHPQASLSQVRSSIGQIIRGLRCMHRLEMIHQDLKPDNILIDQNNTLIIIDFGSTKIAGLAEIKSRIEHQHILGTANYTAPEYFRGETGTNQSDIYSLGVIAYEMLTAKLPYGEIDPLKAHKKKFEYRSARQFNTELPDWIDVCLEKAVHPQPKNRYHHLSELLCDLNKPNQSLLNKKQFKPLMKRSPLLAWRIIAAIEAVMIILLVFLK